MKKLLFLGLLLFGSPAFAISDASRKCTATYTSVITLIRIGAPYEVIMLNNKFRVDGLNTEEYQRVVWEVYRNIHHYVAHVDELHENMNHLDLVLAMTEACQNDWRYYTWFE